MKIEFLKPDKVSQTGIKVNLQKSGKLSFNKGAVETFEINSETNIKIGFDSDNPDQKVIYLLKTTKDDILGKKIFKSGGKTLLQATFALDKLKIEYKNKMYLADCTIIEHNTVKYLKVSFYEYV